MDRLDGIFLWLLGIAMWGGLVTTAFEAKVVSSTVMRLIMDFLPPLCPPICPMGGC